MTDLTMPAGGYVLKAQTVRVECDLLDRQTKELAYPGLWCEVRRNLTIGERRDLQETANAIDARYTELMDAARERNTAFAETLKATPETDTAARAALVTEQTAALHQHARALDQIVIDRFTLIAPHVHRWNLFTVDDAGDYVPVPAPREGGAAIIDAIDADLVGWLVHVTLQAYRLGFVPGSATSGASPEPTPAPSETKPKASRSASRTSPKKSSGPEA
jgi:hypothetical protein